MSELFIDQKFGRVAFGDDREAVLTELGRIASNEFHGSVSRNMTTSLYPRGVVDRLNILFVQRRVRGTGWPGW